MRKRYPLADEIKKFVDNPDAWQWQCVDHTKSGWENCKLQDALDLQDAGSLDFVRLIPKRSLIPSDRLPKGWEVERLPRSKYHIQPDSKPSRAYTCVRDRSKVDDLLYKLLRHIDPEASDE